MAHNESMFRSVFEFQKQISWFPGHMRKTLQTVKGLLDQVNMMVEVRDARAPLSCMNKDIENLLSGKPRLVILNKCDMLSEKNQHALKSYFREQNKYPVLLTSVKTRKNMSSIIPELLAVKPPRFRTAGSNFCIMGVPNVGKSAIIGWIQKQSSDLQQKRSPLVGAIPGITKRVSSVVVCKDPAICMLDTPGVFVPNITNPEIGMRLALIGAIMDHSVGEEELSDYLLFVLNKRQQFDYVQEIGLKRPTDDIADILNAIKAQSHHEDLICARKFIAKYRDGSLGKFVLDELI